MTPISHTELTAILASSTPLLLEALPPKYYDDGHLPGAQRVDVKEVVAQTAALDPPKDAAIVVYCASATCKNSHVAADALTRAGYTNVRVYVEGKQGWTEAGLPLERAPVAIQA